MILETKKLSIIAEVLKIDNELALKALQDFLKIVKNTNSKSSTKKDVSEFIGIWSNKEAEEIKKIISDSCEVIDKDGWN
ncbi:MAG: hypothetical protein H7098_08230 [Oligoflexus sp.]|nr:hypothetical protein [Pseudopedobacter sp.]